MRHSFGFSRNARKHVESAQEGGPDAPFSRNCARSGSTALVLHNVLLYYTTPPAARPEAGQPGFPDGNSLNFAKFPKEIRQFSPNNKNIFSCLFLLTNNLEKYRIIVTKKYFFRILKYFFLRFFISVHKKSKKLPF